MLNLWMTSYPIVEIYVAIHTPVIPRSFNVHYLLLGLVNTYPRRKADERLNDGLLKGGEALSGPEGISIRLLQV